MTYHPCELRHCDTARQTGLADRTVSGKRVAGQHNWIPDRRYVPNAGRRGPLRPAPSILEWQLSVSERRQDPGV